MSKLRRLRDVPDNPGELDEPDDEFWITNDYSPRHGIDGGVYRLDGETTEFRVGYSEYNEWREALALYTLGVTPEEIWTDPEAFLGEPFVRLINFSDCDGVIGGRPARTLARESDENRAAIAERARNATDVDPDHAVWFMEIYDDFARAFALAAEDGCVSFQ